MEDKVQLYVYDLSQGMARQLSPMLLGQQVRGSLHLLKYHHTGLTRFRNILPGKRCKRLEIALGDPINNHPFENQALANQVPSVQDGLASHQHACQEI